MLLNKLIFITFCFVTTLVSSDFGNGSRSLFTEDELQSVVNNSFQLIDGSINVNKPGGFADGEYQLEEWEIEQISNTLYNIQLTFQKKKGFVSYTHNELIGVFYDETQFVIKYHDNIYQFKINQNHSTSHDQVLTFEKNNIKLQFQLF